jgi:hypothetical protein
MGVSPKIGPYKLFILKCLQVLNSLHLLNIELWHYLSVFESHVYGVFLQYSRIVSDLSVPEPNKIQNVPGPKSGLDIYYYVLTWDKLKKICEKIKSIMSRIHQCGPSLPKAFNSEFKLWKRRIDHLFKEFDIKIRNEYEHPSLETYSVGNIIMWGNIYIDGLGKIKAHVGKDWFATIKKEHCIKMQNLRTDLFDLFLKHFSRKPLTKELIYVRNYIEENIDSILKELKECKDKGDTKGFNELLYKFTMHDVYLSKEGVGLSKDAKDKIYCIIWSNELDKQTSTG